MRRSSSCRDFQVFFVFPDGSDPFLLARPSVRMTDSVEIFSKNRRNFLFLFSGCKKKKLDEKISMPVVLDIYKRLYFESRTFFGDLNLFVIFFKEKCAFSRFSLL